MLWSVLAGFIGALAAPFIVTLLRGRSGWVLALLPLSIFIYFFGFAGEIAETGSLRQESAWFTAADIGLSFYLDGLSLIFALLISGIGTFILLFSGSYLAGHPNHGRFMSFLLMFMGSMLGLVLADNVITFFVFWELTSVTSFLLIGFDHERPAARRAALQALIVTGGGGLVMLAGLLMLAAAGGSFEFSELMTRGDLLKGHAAYLPMVLLLLAGAFTKSAQVPFHFWLPNAMEAPTPVSAFLHSATMVKAGVYLVARLNPGLGGTELWLALLGGFGAATFITGVVLAIRRTGLKQILAYTTLASLGLLIMLIGIGTKEAVTAALLYLLAHSFFKGALFLVAGAVQYTTGAKDVTKLGGLASAMPVTMAAAVLAALSMGGLPPFIGFLAKEVIYEATLHGPWPNVFTGISVFGNALMLAAGGIVVVGTFFGARKDTPLPPKEAPPGQVLGPLILALVALWLGVQPGLTEHFATAPGTLSILGAGAEAKHLKLWHGFTPPLILSLVTIAAGAAVLAASTRIRAAINGVLGRLSGADQGYDVVLKGLMLGAGTLERRWQTGRLPGYMTVIFLTVIASLGATLWAYDAVPDTVVFAPAEFYIYGVYALALVGALIIAVARSRLQAIVAMGVVGFSVAIIFLFFGAPDLAYTQFMVETLSVVILALILTRLPVDVRDQRGFASSMRDGLIAAGAGIVMTIMLLNITAGTLDTSLSDFFREKAYTEAYGRNVVNVILVDFRALDTLGEVAVVLLAAVAALTLIKLPTPDPSEEEGGQPASAASPAKPKLGVATERPVLPSQPKQEAGS